MFFLENILPMILLALFIAFIAYFQTGYIFRRSAYYDQQMTYNLRESGVYLETPRLKLEIRWESFPKAVENKNGILVLSMGKRSFHWFPKGGFASPESIEQFRTLLRKQVKDCRKLQPG